MKRTHRMISRLMTIICLVALGMVAVGPAVAFAADYLGPNDVVASADGKTLFVANTDGKTIAVVDAASRKVTGSIAMPAEPTGMVLSPDGKTLYVTCAAPNSTVCAVDVAGGKIKASIPAGHTAIGPAITPDGSKLYVCNRFNDDVSVIDLASGKELARVPVIREPFAAAISPDGKTVFVINHLSLDPSDAYDVACEVTAIDTATNETMNIRLPNGTTGLRGLCISPDGKYCYSVHVLARYQMPTTQLERGWMNTNAMSIIDVENKKYINTVLLDDVDLGAANPWGVACTADGKMICISHAGTHELSVIDAEGMLEKLLAMPTEKSADAPSGAYASSTAADVPNDLAFLVDLKRRIYLQGRGPWDRPSEDEMTVNGPRGLALVGTTAYVACYFTDTLAVVDLQPAARTEVATIALGPKPKMSIQRRGQMYFNDAHLCFQHWQSCASCHPDARADALNWDLMNDGLGNPKNAKSMMLAHKTPPAMISGVRGTAEEAVRAGITHIQFAVRPEEEAVAIDEFLKSLPVVPSPHLENGKLSAAAERGKKLFFDESVGCAKCHPEPLYADLQMHDVGSKGQYDRRSTFDTPTLIEVWRTAPYMHDGHYLTIKDLIVEGKHGAKGGDISKLTPEQIDDLVEFVLSL